MGILGIIKTGEDKDGRSPKELLQSFYVSLFGLVIVFCELKAGILPFDIQAKFFQYFHFLATQPGRSAFYFYVGSITVFMVFNWEFDWWKILFLALGATLALLGA